MDALVSLHRAGFRYATVYPRSGLEDLDWGSMPVMVSTHLTAPPRAGWGVDIAYNRLKRARYAKPNAIHLFVFSKPVVDKLLANGDCVALIKPSNPHTVFRERLRAMRDAGASRLDCSIFSRQWSRANREHLALHNTSGIVVIEESYQDSPLEK